MLGPLGSCTPGQVAGIESALQNLQSELSFDLSQRLNCGTVGHSLRASISHIPAQSSGQGRANAIAVQPGNDRVLLVTTESGGLFRSEDRGAHWTHVDLLTDYEMFSVAFVPGSPDLVIATSSNGFDQTGASGIWVSDNAGRDWVHADNPPTASAASPFYGFGISVAADTGRIFVWNILRHLHEPRRTHLAEVLACFPAIRTRRSPACLRWRAMPSLSAAPRVSWFRTPVAPLDPGSGPRRTLEPWAVSMLSPHPRSRR